MARLDHVVTGFITELDTNIDEVKDQVLRKVRFVQNSLASCTLFLCGDVCAVCGWCWTLRRACSDCLYCLDVCVGGVDVGSCVVHALIVCGLCERKLGGGELDLDKCLSLSRHVSPRSNNNNTSPKRPTNH